MRKYTRDLYARLEAETGQATGFKPVGFIEVAADADRLEEYRRVVGVQPATAASTCTRSPPRRWPSCSRWPRTDDLLAGFYVAEDGRANPVDVTMALAKGARHARRHASSRACRSPASCTARRRGHRRARPPHGDIEAEYVVNCAGMWARQLGAQAGREHPAAGRRALLPDHRARSPGSTRTWPVLEDPASYGYFREEGGGLMIGLFEPVCAPWKVDGIPEDFSFGEIPPDWDRMGPYLEKAMRAGARSPLDVGRPDVLLRPGELHARPAPGRRRGAGAAELLRRRRAELDRHPHRRRPRPGAGALDHRPAARTSTSPASTSTGCTPTRPTPSTARTRTVESLGHGLPVPLPDAVDADRARREAVAAARPAGRAAAPTSATSAAGRAPTGTPPPGVEPVGGAALVGPAELVRRTGRPSTGPRARA